MKKIIPIILFLFLLSSCHKKIIEKNSNYGGEWITNYKSSIFTFKIDSKTSRLFYKQITGDGDVDLKGLARLGKNEIYVKLVSFKIISPPTEIDYSSGQSPIYVSSGKIAKWKMTLKSPKLYGGYENTYYRE